MENWKRNSMALATAAIMIGCAPPMHEAANLASNGSAGTGSTQPIPVPGGLSEAELAAKFSTTLQPVLRANCAGCHGVSQNPKFAVADALEATRTIVSNQLADLNNPANSRFVRKILSGHNGFTPALANQVQSGVEAWAAAAGPGSGGVPTADTEAPAVTLTSPSQGQTISATVTVSALATDNAGVAGVQFLLNGVPYEAEDLVAPYSISLNTGYLAYGSHSLSARARDAAGNFAVSPVVTVTRALPDTAAPSINMTSPSAGTVSGTITISASASDNSGVAGVQFLVNGMPYGAEDTAAPYSMTMNTSGLANGTHAISARARDAAGNTATAQSVSVTVNRTVADTTAPSASISAPAAGASVSGTVTITATASDNVGVAGAQFLINGTAAGSEALAAPYSYSWNTTTIANGTYTLSVRVRDAAGNMTTSASRSVTVNNAAVNPNATYTWISRNITQPKCAGCHSSYGTYTGLRALTRPGNPASSELYTITNSGEMPRGGNKLSATELKAIYDWIAAGSLNN